MVIGNQCMWVQHLAFESQTEVFLVLLLLNKHTLKKISWLKKHTLYAITKSIIRKTDI